MEKEKIRIAVAKLDGYVKLPDRKYTYDGEVIRYPHWKHNGADVESKCVPNYPESWDAIMPVIQRQDESTKARIVGRFIVGDRDLIDDMIELISNTPLQLCIALLKAKGLYEH